MTTTSHSKTGDIKNERASLTELKHKVRACTPGMLALLAIGGDDRFVYFGANDDPKAKNYKTAKPEDDEKAIAVTSLHRFDNPNIVLLTGDNGLEFSNIAVETAFTINDGMLTAAEPNAFTTPNTDGPSNLYLAKRGTGQVEVLSINNDRFEFGGVTDDNKTVLAARSTEKGMEVYSGTYNNAKSGQFTWNKVGDAPKQIAWMGRIDGDYVTIGFIDGTQGVIKGISDVARTKKVTVMNVQGNDTRLPVGRVPGTKNTVALLAKDDLGDVTVHFEPLKGAGAPPIAKMMTAAA